MLLKPYGLIDDSETGIKYLSQRGQLENALGLPGVPENVHRPRSEFKCPHEFKILGDIPKRTMDFFISLLSTKELGLDWVRYLLPAYKPERPRAFLLICQQELQPYLRLWTTLSGMSMTLSMFQELGVNRKIADQIVSSNLGHMIVFDVVENRRNQLTYLIDRSIANDIKVTFVSSEQVFITGHMDKFQVEIIDEEHPIIKMGKKLQNSQELVEFSNAFLTLVMRGDLDETMKRSSHGSREPAKALPAPRSNPRSG